MEYNSGRNARKIILVSLIGIALGAAAARLATPRPQKQPNHTPIAFSFGSIAGALLGGALGLLFSRKSGKILRQDIRRKLRGIGNGAKEYADQGAEKFRDLVSSFSGGASRPIFGKSSRSRPIRRK